MSVATNQIFYLKKGSKNLCLLGYEAVSCLQLRDRNSSAHEKRQSVIQREGMARSWAENNQVGATS